MTYCHTQRAPLHMLLHGVGLALFFTAWFLRNNTPAAVITVSVGCLSVIFGFMFARLTVRDEGDHLLLQYGPVPGFSHRIAYSDVTSVEPGRTRLIDGWGIHWVPGRGWTYNLWGFDCAKLKVAGKTVHIGSDDVENLVGFLNEKIRIGDNPNSQLNEPKREIS